MVERSRGTAMKPQIDPSLAIEAKAITALAFRNGPIEDLHAGKTCVVCAGRPEFSHVSDEEMKRIMKAASIRCTACSGSAITIPKPT